MKIFDTDILTEILSGNSAYADRIANVFSREQAVPIVVVEEIIRRRLNAMRQAEARKGHLTVDQAYGLFEQSLTDLRELRVLSFSPQADGLLKQWRKQKISVQQGEREGGGGSRVPSTPDRRR